MANSMVVFSNLRKRPSMHLSTPSANHLLKRLLTIVCYLKIANPGTGLVVTGIPIGNPEWVAAYARRQVQSSISKTLPILRIHRLQDKLILIGMITPSLSTNLARGIAPANLIPATTIQTKLLRHLIETAMKTGVSVPHTETCSPAAPHLEPSANTPPTSHHPLSGL